LIDYIIAQVLLHLTDYFDYMTSAYTFSTTCVLLDSRDAF